MATGRPPEPTQSERRRRARGALLALAVGDALGAPTQSLPPALIARRYGIVDRFVVAPDDQPIAPNHPAGRITDDTEQALLLARLLIESGGEVEPREWGQQLLVWETQMRARGSLDLLGPSTRLALARLAEGEDPAVTGRDGVTNGAAMRITPVGLATAPGPGLERQVRAASELTHAAAPGLAAAAAVATAVSAGVDGASFPVATRTALTAARDAAAGARWVASASVAARIEAALEVPRSGAEAALDWIADVVGTGVAATESVAAAFAVVAAADGDPWTAARLGASVGGDCDTIAAIAAALAAATGGADLPAGVQTRVLAANAELHDLDAVVDGLLALRDNGSAD